MVRLLRKLALVGIALAGGLSLGVLMRRPGGVLFQQRQGDGPQIPPWPKGGAADPLEEPFGSDADNIRLLTPEALEILRSGGEVVGSPPNFDFTQPGSGGHGRPSPAEWVARYTFHLADGTWLGGYNPPLPRCGQLWIFHFMHEERVPACAGLNYAAVYRATLLRAIAAAYQQCRESNEQCPNARLWLLFASWGCAAQADGPTVAVRLKFAVACVDS